MYNYLIRNNKQIKTIIKEKVEEEVGIDSPTDH